MTEEQYNLLVQSKMDLKTAKNCAKDHAYRAACSRAYYAMFYVAEALLIEKGFSFSKHTALIGAFGKEYTKTGIVPKEYHRYFIKAHERRGIADYDFITTVGRTEVQEILDYAEKFIELGEKMLGPVSEHNEEE